jgi:Mannosyltransferase (PIG-V)
MSTVQEQPVALSNGEPVEAAMTPPADEMLPTLMADRTGPPDVRPVEPASPTDGGPRRRLHAIARPCGYYVLSRVAVLFAALGAKWFAPQLHLLSASTAGWDAHWYTLIAQHGYPHHIVNEGQGSRWAFFPAWPLTIRAAVEVTRLSYVQVTLILCFALGLTSAIALWLAVREVFGSVVADRAVLLYVFFPTAYVLSLGYSEGLFITTCGACLYALSRRYWITAALFAVLGGLSRNFGVVLVACVVVAAGHAFVTNRKIRPLVAVAIAPLGFVSWLLYSWWSVGTPFAFLQAERFWGDSHFVWFTTPILAVVDIFTGLDALKNGQVVLCVLGVAFAYVGIVLLSKARDKEVSIPMFWWVFTIAGTLAMLSSYEPDSVLRYSMAVITVYAAYAWRMRPAWEGPLVGMLGVSQGMLMLIVLMGSMHPHTANLWP